MTNKVVSTKRKVHLAMTRFTEKQYAEVKEMADEEEKSISFFISSTVLDYVRGKNKNERNT